MTIIDPSQVPSRKGSIYPDRFKSVVAGREKKRLGDAAGIKNFGVNLTTLPPKSRSALRHWHTKQDEFIYILSGELTLITDEGESILIAGQAAGFPAGEPNGHCLFDTPRAEATGIPDSALRQAQRPRDNLPDRPKSK